MRFFNLIVICLLLGICWGLIGCSASAGDYTIEKVIEIGPADWVPFLWPIKWSPDGTKISYFSRGYLMISDTLGNTRQVKNVDMLPFRYEWVSDKEIAITFKGREKGGAIPYRLSLLDIENGQETILEQFDRNGVGDDSIMVTNFEGPFKTLEGTVCYNIAKRRYEGSGDYRKATDQKSTLVPIISRTKTTSSQKSMSNDHFVRWGTTGLYYVNADASDSVRIARKPYQDMTGPLGINRDRTYILMGGTMQRLADSTYIVLDTILKQHPPKTVQCGFEFGSFNPSDHEILFQIACDDDKSYEVNQIGTYNYLNNRFVILDSLIGITNGTAPVYAPNGRSIAFLANNKVYIIIRGPNEIH
ncbi:MAG: hypothetical protein NT002_10445 [candidate division Zixibacteria bacterium]|nr:hypothetical protein [candidate division Zixibacteria bacterium]